MITQSGNGSLCDKENGSTSLTDVSNATNSRKPVVDMDADGAICMRNRARYSHASFTLDELETFLQETDDEDDLQNVDDEEEYRKFLAAVLRAFDGKHITPIIAPSCMPPVNNGFNCGFTPHQIGQLHGLIHDHVQLLIQVFSVCVIEPGKNHIAVEVKDLISKMLQKRDEVLRWRTLPYPSFCFFPPYVHPSVPDELHKMLPPNGSNKNVQRDSPSGSNKELHSDIGSLSNGREKHLECTSWVPYICGPVLSVIDVAPLRLVENYMDDVSSAVQAYEEYKIELGFESCCQKEPLFPLHNSQCSADSDGQGETENVPPDSSGVLSSSSSNRIPKKTMAATLLEKAKNQPVALVPNEIAKLAQSLLALGLMEYNTDWKSLQQRFLPCKSRHQIFVRQKNRASSKAPENPIKAVRRMKNSPLTSEEIACIEAWRIASGTQKSYKSDANKKAKQRLYELGRKNSKPSPSTLLSSSEKEETFQYTDADMESISYVPVEVENVKVWRNVLNFLPENVVILSSNNGVLCCRSCFPTCQPMIYICNPLNKQWRTLQWPNISRHSSIALAFDHFHDPIDVSTDFILVAVTDIQTGAEDEYSFVFDIYSSKTGLWRRSKESCQCNHNITKSKGVFVEGILYWLTDGFQILMFDPKNELSWLIMAPLPGNGFAIIPEMCIGESKGKLCYVIISEDGLQQWVLEDNFASQWGLRLSISLDELEKENSNFLYKIAEKVSTRLCIDTNAWMDPLAFKDGMLLLRVSTKAYLYQFDIGRMEKLCDVSSLGPKSMFSPNVVPYTMTLVPLAVEVMSSKDVTYAYRLMLLSQVKKLHTVTTNYASTLRECVETKNLRKAKTIHANLIKKSKVESDSLFIHNHLMNAYVKCGEMANSVQVFDEMPEKNVVSWTVLIAGFVQKGFANEAFSFFCHMHRSSIKPNEFTFVSALHACSFSERLDLICAFQVYALIIRLGFVSNMYLVNAFLTCLIKHDMLDEAVRVFDGSFDKDIVSWNAMFDGYLKFSCDYIPRFWHRMIGEGMKPDEFTFATVLTGLAELSNLQMGLQVHALLVKFGHGSERCVGNALVDMYLKNQRLNDGFGAFEEIPIKDVCSWTQMAAGCLNSGEPNEALRVIREMRRVGVKPNKFTLATGLNACANLASLEEGKKVQGIMIKLGDDIDICVDNALLDMYAKCGYIDGALRVFRTMNEHNVVSWTTMIMGYAQNGHPKEALEIFEEMHHAAGANPNYITFICVLYACSQGGYINSGWKYYSCMRNEYGIAPGEDHYVCMVNLLGRAGRIREAEELIEEMPFEPGVVIWQTLLGACRLHGDVETAKRAAERAFALDENDPSTYVLLSNTFADFENWISAGRLRKWIENRHIKKMPGSSWLEINEDR
ncbi:hypothetical protein BUALT_Bualt06G0062000 [Buddleja alternifolia]|uniref:F-box protein At3g26010-like beta-propeller domain-containing protein n=1 Tax=Buddleja alternifolia TaxID=168488 RepID=A0AAV6XCQ3_9LAMI|nr:hypothetical protein BUALT_Bualt06G0062000 [Buddleja alternifolia]